ncbi:MAG: MBL fold metallo-hydrolase [Candidatus Rokubacteria bacterium]|nr:MBL fold metallo-hydrolase [Candidatus Rokubacteria bacterium]
MIFRRFVAAETGRASYLVGCERVGRAAVIDPQPDVTPALCAAAEASVRITHIFATHTHGHDSSGAHRLARVTGAPVLLHEAADVSFPHVELEDGEEHDMGTVRVGILCTPGHTADSISILVTDRTRGAAPRLVLTGDTLFSGGVGRPEPGPGATEVWLAGQLYESLFRRLLSLPDPVEVFPAQGAAHCPGTEPEPRVVTTIGLERQLNPALQCASPNEFARFVRGHGIP